MSEQYTTEAGIERAHSWLVSGLEDASIIPVYLGELRALTKEIERLRAALSAEREACAKVCDGMHEGMQSWRAACEACADSIRNRNERTVVLLSKETAEFFGVKPGPTHDGIEVVVSELPKNWGST